MSSTPDNPVLVYPNPARDELNVVCSDPTVTQAQVVDLSGRLIKNFNVKPGENKLKGTWASTCYEQGIMNLILIKDYLKYSTVFSINMVLCTNNLYLIDKIKKVFILHYL